MWHLSLIQGQVMSLINFMFFFDNNFTTVPYLCTATVPPQWADLVHSSATKQIGTWQSIPDMEIKQGDFSGKRQPPLLIKIARE
jgi:hypothetical protein